jgi:hypothetical protein
MPLSNKQIRIYSSLVQTPLIDTSICECCGFEDFTDLEDGNRVEAIYAEKSLTTLIKQFVKTGKDISEWVGYHNENAKQIALCYECELIDKAK